MKIGMAKRRGNSRAGGTWLVLLGIVVVVAVIVFAIIKLTSRDLVPDELQPISPAPPEAVEKPVATPTVPVVDEAGTGVVETVAAATDDGSGISLIVSATPVDGAIYLDGRRMGWTPARIKPIDAGNHVVRVVADGYLPYEQTIGVTTGQAARLQAILSPLPTGLLVQSDPSGAEVKINAEMRGTTPLALGDIAPGRYRVEVTMEGFESAERDVTVTSTNKTTVRVELEPVLGMISAGKIPEGTTIYINDHELNKSRSFVEPGRHVVRIERPGFVTKTFTVNVGKGRVVDIDPSFDKAFEADTEVETTDGSIYRGKLRRELPDGALRMEIAPGQFRLLPAAVIVEKRSLLESEPQP